MGRSHRGGVAALVVVLLVLGAAAAMLTGQVPSPLDRRPATAAGPTAAGSTTPGTGPSSAPVAGLLQPSPAAPAPVLAGLPRLVPPPTTAGLQAALGSLLGTASLGPDVGAVVLDGASGAVLLDQGGSVAHTPASTLKLLTGAAALQVIGPQTRLTTSVVRGAAPGELVLVGGGDPLLTAGETTADETASTPASLRELARRTAAAMRAAGVHAARVSVDDTLFAPPAIAPTWEKHYVPSGVVAPVSALMVDQARTTPASSPGAPTGARHADPALAAGQQLATLLAAEGITVSAPVARATAAAGAQPLATVESPAVGEIVERMLTTSDNDIAEALLRLVAVRSGAPATFDGGTAATIAALQQLGVPTQGVRLSDGSGLARLDAVPARTLAAVLVAAASPEHPALRPLLSGLPVAGFNGTLAGRFTDGGARGIVRAKTGSLTGVSTLAGTLTDADGSLLVFAVLADEVPQTGTLAA
ncbi:MAG TPA: D-alanyl-D-alanine carboxypeptidase/D-alanyl-D-alanine-endopeptidase, partial [Actinomycetes bacterium]|nr:D-alanyl-D-alanine carboxypeptidase/D-alanyl-D-alanine-endopeptidase [Actinomycetes bacterium]